MAEEVEVEVEVDQVDLEELMKGFIERGKKILEEPSGEKIEKRKRRRRIIAEERERKYPRGVRSLEDPYRIGPVGGSEYGSGFKILEIHGNFVYLYFQLLGRGEDIDGILEKYKDKCVRIGEFDLEWNCGSKYTDKIARKAGGDALIRVRVIVIDYYSDRESMIIRGDLDSWFNIKARESGERISDTECEDWNSNFKGFHRRVDEIRKDEICPCILLTADLADIEVMLREIKENIDNIDYVLELVKDIDDLLDKRKCGRKNIKGLITRFGLDTVRFEGKLLFGE